jgi:hypothetical protein
MKKNRGGEPFAVILHIYMKISQGNSPCSYLYLKQAKMSFFLFLFFFYKIGEQEDRTCPACVLRGRLVPVGGGSGRRV